MKKLLILVCLTAALHPCNAQSTPDSAHAPHTKWKSFFDNFRLRFPTVDITYYIPVKNGAFLHFSDGMDKFLYNRRPEVSALMVAFKNNYSFRWFCLYYKDTWGIESYISAFGADVGMDDFNRYLEAKFPNYDLNPVNNNNISSLSFSGLRYGITHKIHWKNFILEPKLQIGFESLGSDTDRYMYRFKEKGSNQFIEHNVALHSTGNTHSYRAQLYFARRFFIKNSTKLIEVGIKAGYMFAPYSMQATVSEKSYGIPETTTQFNWKESFQVYNVGLYGAFFLKK